MTQVPEPAVGCLAVFAEADGTRRTERHARRLDAWIRLCSVEAAGGRAIALVAPAERWRRADRGPAPAPSLPHRDHVPSGTCVSSTP